MKCRICSLSTTLFDEAVVLKKYRVKYYWCENCGFMQTEKPYWLDEAYSRAITKSDIGLIGRNLQMVTPTRKLILTCLEPTDKFVDYGGGYGIFTRLMRDQGFDYYRHDPLCENLFAGGFEASSNIRYTLLTAWEVFEHLENPLDEIEEMLSYSHNLFFSTVLLSTSLEPLDQWWYYGLEHGQHIAFYSHKTLQIIAQKFRLKTHFSDGRLHFIGDPAVPPFLIKLAFSERLSWLQKRMQRTAPPSLLASDFQALTGKVLK
ncbi:hypothetical protein ANAEL_00374 [Anaerolineales bacterium]|nr:hypothetical protein ANAEL_00374 [Anaerolineales bacterium]